MIVGAGPAGLEAARVCAERGHDKVNIVINRRLLGATRKDNQLAAIIGSDYNDESENRVVDQIVVEHGTLPLDDLYFELKENAINRGEIDYSSLAIGTLQTPNRNPDGDYQLYRIGDAVASPNIHAAVYDALRLCKDL